MRKLAIVTTHPIQYNAPWFQLLAQRKNISIKVFYTWSQSKTSVTDATFGKEISWDIPLLEGYDYEFIENTAKDPGVHHFFGINCPQLIDHISDYKPDTVLVFGWNFKSHLKVLRHFKKKIPVWFRGDSTLLDETSGIKTNLRRIVLSLVYKYVDKALYVGTANKAYFLKHGLTEKQLAYVPHAIDNERFGDNKEKQYEEKALQWRAELGFSVEDTVVLFAGKFESKKQPDFLMNAVISANEKRARPLQLILVGDGPMAKELKDRAKAFDFITFIPFQNQSQMPIIYRLGNVFCLPSKGPGETWGLAINEAMASSRAVICSNKVGCASDVVKEGSNGYIFHYDDEFALMNVFRKLSIQRLKTMGEVARNDINQWNFKAIVEALEHNLKED